MPQVQPEAGLATVSLVSTACAGVKVKKNLGDPPILGHPFWATIRPPDFGPSFWVTPRFWVTLFGPPSGPPILCGGPPDFGPPFLGHPCGTPRFSPKILGDPPILGHPFWATILGPPDFGTPLRFWFRMAFGFWKDPPILGPTPRFWFWKDLWLFGRTLDFWTTSNLTLLLRTGWEIGGNS